MTIAQRIDKDLVEALKAREAERLGSLRMAKTALKLRETEVPGSLGDEDALRVLNTLIKQRRDSAEQFRAAGREDLAQKEEREAKVIQEYLPGAASADDMTRAVEDAVAETGATSPKDMGAVMKAARARLQGKTIDGKALSDLVKSARSVSRPQRSSAAPFLTARTPPASVSAAYGVPGAPPTWGQEGRRCETAATPSL